MLKWDFVLTNVFKAICFYLCISDVLYIGIVYVFLSYENDVQPNVLDATVIFPSTYDTDHS